MGNEQAVRIHRGEFVPSRQCDDQITMNHQRRWRPDNDQSSVRSCREATDASLNLVGIAHVCDALDCMFARMAESGIASMSPAPKRGVGIRKIMIAVGTLITERPPHRAERAPFGHSAPTSGI